jgi:hypothetical protein
VKGRKPRWYVFSLHGHWWHKGQWHREPVEGSSNAARPKTKQGAVRIALKCPGVAEILHAHADGTSRSIVVMGRKP